MNFDGVETAEFLPKLVMLVVKIESAECLRSGQHFEDMDKSLGKVLCDHFCNNLGLIRVQHIELYEIDRL